MENIKQSYEQLRSSLTEQINNLIIQYQKKELTQKLVNEWLETIPAEKRKDAVNQLEEGLSYRIINLPE